METVNVSRKHRRIGRNSYCPCGSRKKYKKCCLDKNRKSQVIVDFVPFKTDQITPMANDIKYYSNAKWTKIGNSQDTHSNSGMAHSICNALITRWGVGREPCEVRGHCLKSWVTTSKGE